MRKERRDRKKDNQVKENLQKRNAFRQKKKRNQGKTNIQEREQKMRMSQKKKNRQELTQKRKHFLVKGIEKGQTCSKPTNL